MSSIAAPGRSPPPREVPPHASAAELVAAALDTDASVGLSEVEAAARLADIGPNIAAPVVRPGYLRIGARQFEDPLVALLLAAALVSAGIGERFEGAVIAAIVLLNAILGFAQEAGAERALLALTRIRELLTSVIREGTERTLPAAELVPGDLVVVREGDRVPADARIIAAERLAVDESLLTGESAPVEKDTGAVSGGTPLAERHSMRLRRNGCHPRPSDGDRHGDRVRAPSLATSRISLQQQNRRRRRSNNGLPPCRGRCFYSGSASWRCSPPG